MSLNVTGAVCVSPVYQHGCDFWVRVCPLCAAGSLRVAFMSVPVLWVFGCLPASFLCVCMGACVCVLSICVCLCACGMCVSG